MTQQHLPRFLKSLMTALAASACIPAVAAIEETTNGDDAVVALQETNATTAATDASMSSISANNPKGLRGLETYVAYNHLNAGFKQWREIGIRGLYERGRHLIYAEAAAINRFNESGNYVAIGDTITLSDDWYTALTVGAGSGASYLPDYRLDGFLNRKFLPNKNLVGTLGLGYSKIPDGHTNNLQNIGFTYYFNSPWVVQGGVTRNTSNPGDVQTTQQFLATTWGQQSKTLVTARYGWGREGWLALGGSNFVSNFSSHQASFSLRQWLGPKWGASAGYEQYKNPFYTRKGLNLSLFWEL
jgi:YaiO family outer membrane protein